MVGTCVFRKCFKHPLWLLKRLAMAFSRKISGRSASRKNPVLQSSLEYDQYLKAKMHPTSDRGSPSRGSERERPPQERRRAPMDRPSPPPSYMRGTKSTSRGGDSAEEKGDSFDIPMQHSWKRYVPPAQSADPAQPLVDAATLGTFDFSKVPETPQDVASLMAAARASIEVRDSTGLLLCMGQTHILIEWFDTKPIPCSTMYSTLSHSTQAPS